MESGKSGWGWSGIGALLALGLALLRGALHDAELAPPGPVALWAIDRDGGRLYGLDEDLILARSLPLAAPIELARAVDGRLFVLRAPGFLDELDAQGALMRELEVGACLDLDTCGNCAVLVQQLPDAGPRRVLCIEPELAPRVLGEGSGLRCIAGSLDSVLVGTDDGLIERLALDGSGRIGEATLGSALVDLARADDGGGAFALDAAGQRLLHLGPDLGLRWQEALPVRARHLAAVACEDRVWLADTESPRILRYGPGGKLELDRAFLPLSGLDRVLAWKRGSLLLAAPGAILQLDAQGHLAPGQGGFNYLAGLAR